MIDFITFPARPLSGSKIELAPPPVLPTMWSPKLNGWRVLVHCPTGTCFNRQGEPLTIASELTEALEVLKKSPYEWIDGEALLRRHKLNQKSILIIDAVSREPALDRYYKLKKVFPVLKISRPQQEPVLLIPQLLLVGDQVTRLWNQLQKINKELKAPYFEGLCSKFAEEPYPIQRSRPDMKAKGWMKFRFLT